MTKRARAKVGDRVQLRRAPVLPWEDDAYDPAAPHGLVLSAVEAQRGLSAGASFATIQWDTGSRGRNSLGMLRVLTADEDANA